MNNLANRSRDAAVVNHAMICRLLFPARCDIIVVFAKKILNGDM